MSLSRGRITTVNTKKVTLRAIKPNAGKSAKYRAQLNDLLRSCRADVLQLVEQGSDRSQNTVAMDGVDEWLARGIDSLIARWVEKLNGLAQPMAEEFTRGMMGSYDNNLRSQLKKHGFSVNLQLSRASREAYLSVLTDNVGLIRSTPMEYLNDVSKGVWSAVSGKSNLGELSEALDKSYSIGRKRARLIARDQSNKATASIEQARRTELGIKEAVWQHSSAAKVPRQSHVRANGKTFEVEKGMYLDGKWTLPGYEINCGCTSRAIIRVSM